MLSVYRMSLGFKEEKIMFDFFDCFCMPDFGLGDVLGDIFGGGLGDILDDVIVY
jgi:hypothetical protein